MRARRPIFRIAFLLLLSAASPPCVGNQGSGQTIAPIVTRTELFCEWGVLVPVKLKGTGPFWMILDSASGLTTLSMTAARDLALQLGPSRKGRGAGENSYALYAIDALTPQISGVDVNSRPTAVADLQPTEEIAGRRLDGILGNELFRNYVVDVDYSGRLSLIDPKKFLYNQSGTVLPLEESGRFFFTNAIFDPDGSSPKSVRLLVDTGAFGVPLLLNTPFVRANRLARPGMLRDTSGIGQGGTVQVLLTRADKLQIGDIEFRNLLVALSQDEGGALASSSYDGILGAEILRRFHVIFDLPHHQMILESTSRVNEPFDADHSGMALRAKAPNFKQVEIYRVIVGSPASEAGLSPGDYLEAVDGKPAMAFGLSELRRMLRDGTRSYVLKIRRGGATRTIRVTLRKLL